MSKASIESALTSLIPTLNGPLPPELVDVAVSLLTRSRSVAHSLKADEEIARPYACAQLACERLKKRLNLPVISPRPPCPPRIYKKLFNYLESALPASVTARAPQTPRKATTSAPPLSRTAKTPISAKKTPRSTRQEDDRIEPPEWVMPAIRNLVKAFSYPTAAPHIFTGAESIIPLLARMSAAEPGTPSKRPRRTAAMPRVSASELTDTRILGLIAVLLFYILSRMKDQDITPEQYLGWRQTAVSTLLKTTPGKDTSEVELEAEIERLMPTAQEEGWLQMEWFLNVTPPTGSEEMEGVETTSAVTGFRNNKSSDLRDGGSDYIGLGTMMQEATDYLGARQREDYKRWKANILARVEAIEAS